jgi:hypothetical protein
MFSHNTVGMRGWVTAAALIRIVENCPNRPNAVSLEPSIRLVDTHFIKKHRLAADASACKDVVPRKENCEEDGGTHIKSMVCYRKEIVCRW